MSLEMYPFSEFELTFCSFQFSIVFRWLHVTDRPRYRTAAGTDEQRERWTFSRVQIIKPTIILSGSNITNLVPGALVTNE